MTKKKTKKYRKREEDGDTDLQALQALIAKMFAKKK
jgi:chaperonin cofactor prefoldin